MRIVTWNLRRAAASSALTSFPFWSQHRRGLPGWKEEHLLFDYRASPIAPLCNGFRVCLWLAIDRFGNDSPK
jgi:hypothetical protein